MKRDLLIKIIAITFAVVQLCVPVFLTGLIDIQLRSLHLAIGLSLALLLFSPPPKSKEIGFIELATIAIIIWANVNIFIKAFDIYITPGASSTIDIVLGTFLTIIILYIARRSMGWPIPALVLLFFAYIFLGKYMPGIWKLRGLSLRYVINSVYWSPLGIYGSLTGMSATFISMFILFGSLIAGAGAGKTFIDLALALTGKYRGGPAKTAIVSSALFGSISGSGVANVCVTGNYTIPLMKRLGYDKDFAAAVEAIASTGGIITPPLMGIAAFMMSEFLGIPYIKIMGYALIPCILFYTGVYGGVHFYTLKHNLSGVPNEEIPKLKDVLKPGRILPLVVPTGVLIYLIATGKPLMYAGFYGSLACILTYLFFHLKSDGVKSCLRTIAEALEDGGKNLSRLVPILVSVNILVNMIGMTGLAPKLSGLITEVGRGNLFLSLIIATIIPFILGTSLPVAPTYILCISILSAPLLELGIRPEAVHLFFIYWSMLGGVTPPTCTQAMVAAGISGGNWVRTGFLSMKLGVVAFIIPFFFVLNPSLIGLSSWPEIILSTSTGFIGIIILSFSLFWDFKGKAGSILRGLLFMSGLFTLYPSLFLSVPGLAIAILSVIIGKRMGLF
ncbi:MAG: TRAP transporter fused permease subunit [Synergistetes bacterium]|nr:TRAP transporter fused permease subunit [Synergistota bacterium]